MSFGCNDHQKGFNTKENDYFVYDPITLDNFTNGVLQINHTHFRLNEIFKSSQFYSCNLSNHADGSGKQVEVIFNDFSWTDPRAPLKIQQTYNIKSCVYFLLNTCYVKTPIVVDPTSDTFPIPAGLTYIPAGNYLDNAVHVV